MTIENTLTPAERLSRAIQFRTISTIDPAKFDPAPFIGIHQFLAEAYPLVHSRLQRQTVNQLSLLYTWQGSEPGLKPLLLTGHLDVVPVESGTESTWSQPAFSGQVEGGFIWGRGTLDCKCTVFGILEAVESLLAKGFQPRRTLLLGFGHDEEIGGMQGAAKIAAHLKEKGIELEAVLDEGLAIIDGLLPGVKEPVALVGTAEKGYLSLELTATGKGGHSSMPPKEKSISLLMAALLRLERHPMPARLDSITSQMFGGLQPLLPSAMRLVVKFRKFLAPLIIRTFGSSDVGNANMRTTMAPTMLRAGEKDNVLPQKAVAVVNFRLLPGDTTQQVISHVRRAIDDERISIAPLGGFMADPSPISETDSHSFRAIGKAIQQAFGVRVVAPGLVTGGTDCRNYAPLSRNCYRFSPIHVTPTDLKRVHGTDERIEVNAYHQAIGFFVRVIEDLCGPDTGKD